MSLLRALLLPTSALAASSLLVSHFEGNVYSLTLSDDASDLSVASQTAVGGMPSWLTLDADSGTVYVTDESWFGNTKFTALSVGSDGALTATGTAPTQGGELHSCLYGGDDGKGFIAAAQYNTGAIITYKLPLSASASALQTLKFTMSGPGPRPDRQDQPHPHSTFTDPTGRYLLSADLGADLVRIFSIDAASGTLTECPAAVAPPGSGPRHGAFWAPSDASDSDINVLFTVNEIGNSVTAWGMEYPEGGCLTLTQRETISTFPEGTAAPQGSKAAEVRVRDNFVYATNRFDMTFGAREDSIAMFEITDDQGTFEFVEVTSAHTYFPRTFDINAAGDMVAVGGQTSSNVAVLERNVTSGRLGGLLAELSVGRAGGVNQEDGLSAVIWNE